MNPFAALLMGPQAAPEMGVAPPVQNEIIVPGERETMNAPASDPYADFVLNNSDAIRERVAAAEDGAEAAQHKGMFGTKGTLRDVLGLIGDSFLMGNGQNPLYYNKRNQEKLGDAFTGYSVDPTAAAERGMGVNPAAAMEMAQYAQRQDAAIQAARNQMADNQRLGTKDSRDAYNEGAKMFGSLMGALNQDTYQQAIPMLTRMKEVFGLGDEFVIPPEFDSAITQMYQYGTMPTSRQISSQQRGTQLDISQQNADTAARQAQIRANTARPRSISRQELFQQYSNIPRNERTVEQQEYIEEYTGQNRSTGKKKKSLGGSTSNTPATSTRTFEINGRTFQLKGS